MGRDRKSTSIKFCYLFWILDSEMQFKKLRLISIISSFQHFIFIHNDTLSVNFGFSLQKNLTNKEEAHLVKIGKIVQK